MGGGGAVYSTPPPFPEILGGLLCGPTCLSPEAGQHTEGGGSWQPPLPENL